LHHFWTRFMHYLVGDIQGCCDAFERLLAELDFSPSRDHVAVLGDLVNRGPGSLATLQALSALGNSASCLLGNHDLHLLAVMHGLRPLHPSDTLTDILESPRRAEWLEWIRHRPMALSQDGWLLVHAGVAPQWDLPTTLQLASEVEQCLRGPNLAGFLAAMYGNEPSLWRADLAGHDRLRFTVNVLTRIRFVDADGRLELKAKESASAAPPGHLPWFDAPSRGTAGVPIAFGHWSTLGLVQRQDLLALDTGCVWGGKLTAARIDGGRRDITQVVCEQAQRPG
jgi:bis(5'-nucleosyl)-tetraphosphatase (symmetrical)